MHIEEAWFVFLDDLDNISILLDESNDLVKKNTNLFNEVFLFSSLKKTINQALNIQKICSKHVPQYGELKRFELCFPVL